jgi:feruloyl esterase
MYTLAPHLFGDAGVDWTRFSPADAQRARASAFAKEYEATDANLAPFFRGGGRLLVWHGEDDAGPSPVGTNDYAQRVVKANSGGGASRFRHFLVPGTGHCGGGPGAFQVDWLDAMDKWVDSGKAPDTVIGSRPDGPLVRKHCAWPKTAHYKQSGDPNDPANWMCVADKS